MSDRITWQPCPRCGSRSAVGWESVPGVDGDPAHDVPVEFDCMRGCPLDRADLRRWLGSEGGLFRRAGAGRRVPSGRSRAAATEEE